MAKIFHHSAVRVADIDRAIAFYEQAFDGRLLHRPVRQEGEMAVAVMGGPPGVAFAFAYVGFEDGAVELFEFVGDAVPEWGAQSVPGRLPHFALAVGDARKTVARVERAGGRHLWPEILSWGDSDVTFVADPDGNAIELLTASVDRIVEMTVELFPDAAL